MGSPGRRPPLTRRSNITDVLEAVCGVSLDAATTLICVDQIHNLNLGTRHGAEASDTLKYFAELNPRHVRLRRDRRRTAPGCSTVPGASRSPDDSP